MQRFPVRYGTPTQPRIVNRRPLAAAIGKHEEEEPIGVEVVMIYPRGKRSAGILTLHSR